MSTRASKILPLLLALTALPAPALTDTVLPTTAVFEVNAQLVAGCGVAGGGAEPFDFGTLDFGSHPAIATGEVDAAVAGGAIQIVCSPDTTLSMTIDGGLDPSEGNTQRNLQGPVGARIAYRLYVDAGHAQAIAVGQPVVLTVSGEVGLPVYGALTLPGNGAVAGTYTDTAQVMLSY